MGEISVLLDSIGRGRIQDAVRRGRDAVRIELVQIHIVGDARELVVGCRHTQRECFTDRQIECQRARSANAARPRDLRSRRTDRTVEFSKLGLAQDVAHRAADGAGAI